MHPRNPRRPFYLAASLALATLAWEGRTVQADPSPVVAKVGNRTITADELERRMAQVPPFQLRTFGSTPDEIKKAFLTRVMIRELLLVQGAEARGLGEREDVRERVRGVMRNAMLAKIRSDVQANQKPTDDDLRAYYEKNAAKFHAPARVGIWQIVVAKREEALEILAELKKDPSPKRFTDLAREKSIDKTTNMRGGNLGFVAPDGSTSEPGVKASPEVLKAVASVKDAELVSEPVKDGDRWAVVWRRQGMKPIDRALDLEAGSIRQILLHERTEAKMKEIIAGQRKANLHDHSPELAELVDVSGTGEVAPVRRPGTMPSGKRPAANPVPGANNR